MHVLPHAQIRPVFVCDKQRKGDVRMFIDLDGKKKDLAEYSRYYFDPFDPI